MAIATHIIKIKGTFDEKIYKQQKTLKDYVNNKIQNEIDSVLHADLELFKVDGNNIEVWVYISAFPSEVTRDIIGKWIKDHIKEEGISVQNFEFEQLVDKTKRLSENSFYVSIP